MPFICAKLISPKSILLTTIMVFSSAKLSEKFSKLLISIIKIFKSANSAFCNALFTPSFSIKSSVALMPAVSEMTTGTPEIFK